MMLLCECGSGERTGKEFVPVIDKSLRVVFTPAAPGYFTVGGQQYGYCMQILDIYADTCGRQLEISAKTPAGDIWNNLESNIADVVVALTAEADPGALAVGIGVTRYVVLGRKDVRSDSSIQRLVGDGTVKIVPGFQITDTYDAILDSLSGAQLYVCARDVSDLASEIAAGGSDFLICEASEAGMALEFLAGLRIVYRFDEEVGLSLVFPRSAAPLFTDFSRWWSEYASGAAASELKEAYLGEGVGGRIARLHRNNSVVGGISVWDDLIRSVGEREGVDWRLLSAIAYKESRFLHNVTSGRGATGLMQIMPVTARHFKVDEARLSDPEVNITLAAKLIKSIGQSLGFSPATQQEDKLSIILAAYNCGVGTVADARRLAAARGWNPDSWADISQCLSLMGDNSYRCDSVAFRKFSGCGETLAFVDGVRKKYDSYRRSVE